MVFNLHDQFERLRAEGRYDKLRDTILARDVALAGSVNPMLAEHGTHVARRGSIAGARSSDDWHCPFSGRSAERTDDCRMKSRRASGTAFTLDAGQRLTVIDPKGGQVADLLAFNRDDIGEVISAGPDARLCRADLPDHRRHALFQPLQRRCSTSSRTTVGRHDFLLTPCCKATFRIIYGDQPTAPRLLRQSRRGAGALWRDRGHDPDRVQLLHERAGRWRDRARSRCCRR